MPKLNAVSNTEKVSEYIQKLESPIKEIVEFIRQVILSTDNEIAEQIKWNSPSFYYNGEMKDFDAKEYKRDILVMNLHRGNILLVLPTGAKINDTTGILEGNYTDGRKLIKIKDLEDAKSKEDGLRKVLKEWLSQVEK